MITLLASLLLSGPQSPGQANPQAPHLVVMGTAERSVPASYVRYGLRLTAEHTDPGKAHTELSRKTEAIKAVLQAQPQVSELNEEHFQQRFVSQDGGHYQAQLHLNFKFALPGDLRTLLQNLVEAEPVEIHYLGSFLDPSREEELVQALFLEAYRRAYQKGKALAQVQGQEIESVYRVEEDPSPHFAPTGGAYLRSTSVGPEPESLKRLRIKRSCQLTLQLSNP
jgi:Uncharacterized conserved protein